MLTSPVIPMPRCNPVTLRASQRLLPLAVALMQAGATLPAGAETPLAVEIVTAEARADVLAASLTGEIAARNTLSASFPAGGRVSDVLVEDGDHVVQGAVLARVESVQQEQALRAAEAGLSTAQADYRQAVENLQRQDALLRRGATTRTGRDSAEDALHIAEGALTQAGAELDRAQKALADTVLLAPMDATVIDRKIEPGQVVGAAQSVMDLALGPDMDAIFEVPEAVLVNNETRSGIDLVLIEYPEQHFTGQAREVSPLVDEKTGTVEATVSVINPPPAISYGDAVRATVQIQGPPRVALPYTAMSALAEGPAVWVVDPATMKVSLQPIVIDRFDTGRILVASGLADGTLVVGRGAQLLYPGRTVRQAGGAE